MRQRNYRFEICSPSMLCHIFPVSSPAPKLSLHHISGDQDVPSFTGISPVQPSSRAFRVPLCISNAVSPRPNEATSTCRRRRCNDWTFCVSARGDISAASVININVFTAGRRRASGRGERERERKKNLTTLFNVTGPVITRRLMHGGNAGPPTINNPSVITKLA